MRCGIFIDSLISLLKSKIFIGILTGVISGIISGYMVSEYYKELEKKEQQKYHSLALEDIGYTIQKQIMVYQNMYKATAISLNERDNNIDHFFRHFFTRMIFLDLEKNAPEINYNKYTLKHTNKMWITYLKENVHKFRKELEYKLDKYMIFLKPKEIDMLKKMKNNFYDTFILIMADEYYKDKKEKRRPVLYNKSAEPFIKEAIDTIKMVIKFYDNLEYNNKVELFDKEFLFHKNLSPKIGSGRIDIVK